MTSVPAYDSTSKDTPTLPGFTAIGTMRRNRWPPIHNGWSGPRRLVSNECTSRWWSTKYCPTPTAASPRNTTPRTCAELPRCCPFARAVLATMWRRRSWRLHPVGMATGTAPTWLPSSPARVRPDTGTEMTSCAGCSPLRSSNPSRLPATAASTRSLTVAPCRCPASTTSANRASTVRTCRRADVGRRIEVRATRVGRLLPSPISRMPATSRRRLAPALLRTARRCATASRRTWRRVGTGRGARGCGTGTPSTSPASAASPPIPSARTWCSTITTRTSAPLSL